ncbi:M48 family metalloprotease [Neptunomonas antarctica]|uniref:Putative beta-barrel assembly-enhancing protease n=1 Tax=Neptunomonas antarctica TaxID=619304 RepID=A0A1N7JVT9_9GAMM|nr:M48 family metalloprotease [Neptunomonas antarctica]SIS53462.1 Putative Zn-dependent protease, contains TPR repeats [Neptunomonas antarctica]
MRFLNIFLCAAIISVSSMSSAATLISTDNSLPMIGDSTSGIISLDKEHRVGQAWARTLRGSVPLLNDPIAYSYLYDLLWQLTAHSQLQDKRLELIVLDNPTLNAFAVPGGIVGIHGGLLLSAENEDELASVIAHELAHLSQRHFAAQLEESRRNRPFTLATMLASILIASADTQAGVAAITSSIAAQQSSRLAFSRQNEQEADRIGMQNLVAAGVDPNAMPRMFSRMQRAQRFQGARPPEFLLTHPVTESRIADSLNRAAQLPIPSDVKPSLYFDLTRTRLSVHFANNPQKVLNYYQTEAEASQTPLDYYGLAVASIRLNQFKQAQSALSKLPASWKQHLFVKLTEAELQIAAEAWLTATKQLEQLANIYPGHYAVELLLAKAYMGAEQPNKAIQVLNKLKLDYPTDINIWYLLSEALGQAGKTNAVHQARVEYFLLTGQIDKALQQITFATREPDLSSSDIARLKQLEIDTKRVREEMKMDL